MGDVGTSRRLTDRMEVFLPENFFQFSDVSFVFQLPSHPWGQSATGNILFSFNNRFHKLIILIKLFLIIKEFLPQKIAIFLKIFIDFFYIIHEKFQEKLPGKGRILKHENKNEPQRISLWRNESFQEILEKKDLNCIQMFDKEKLKNFLEMSKTTNFIYDNQWRRLFSLEFSLDVIKQMKKSVN